MTKYRIAFNGYKYAIQLNIPFLWIPSWNTLRICDSRDEADELLTLILEKELQINENWRPV
jgi:hypothetical protein